MYRTGANKLKREVEEKAQNPDFEKMWRLQDEINSTTSSRELETKTKELEELRANQPRRHPLWAFFHEKTKRDAEDLDKYAKFTKGPNGEDIPPPGYYALGNALNRPHREASRSGEFVCDCSFFLSFSRSRNSLCGAACMASSSISRLLRL